ncbi:MAG TPA: RNA methyltransferase [Vicinamibacterales bacterium]|nr:RNA methyltransferase [Vicinamibacterales bacterium]
MRIIHSRQNPIVNTFRTLADEPDSAAARLLLDGAHLVHEARVAGARFEVVAVAASKLTSQSEEGLLARALEADGVDVVEASDAVFEALSPVKSPSGIVAIIGHKQVTPAEISSLPDALILAAVDVQEPGNVGALLRAAEAGGVTGAFVCGSSANPFSWKALRGSMGSALRLPVVGGMTTHQVLTCIRKSSVRTVAAVPRGGQDPDAIDWRGKVALLLGGEGPGLTDEAIALCDARVSIPMASPVESLNVAAAGAILVYAARRQRS